MTEREPAVRAGQVPDPLAARLRRAGEVVLLVWVLAIFYHFYESQEFYQLLVQLASPSP